MIYLGLANIVYIVYNQHIYDVKKLLRNILLMEKPAQLKLKMSEEENYT